MPGDHRGMVIDIDISTLLGKREIEHGFSSRKLTVPNPSALEKYLGTVKTKFEKQKIFKRAKKLLERVKIGHTDMRNIKLKYKQLDADVFGICTNAEKNCRKTLSGTYEWSPKLNHGIQTITYWRHRQKNKYETTLLRKMREDLDIEYLPLTRDEIQTKIKESREALNDIQKKLSQIQM